MWQKQERSFFRSTFDKLSVSFHQVQEAISGFFRILEQIQLIGQASHEQNPRPIPIIISAEPEIIEKVKVKVQW